MGYTEKQILEKTKIILKDLKGKYYTDSCINKISFRKEKEVSKPERNVIAAWTLSVKTIFDNLDFLTISDETGEPLYYQNFTTKILEIAKDENGKYCRVKKG
ncbi:hypothetical protein [uncultured Chryseobacterium sp.]|uniref:hypothetical protein n=1 Tax=uncultured Chryseobacterium sp. TaxID=259322 RepID=UPI0025833613|nr:hypothetical protein [uncultured Chryseobacterium sp.]